MKINIVNFQSLADVEIEVHGFTVLVGGSNLGKSALIRALEGALYNRSGFDFVRQGATQTIVSIEGLPTSSGPHNVFWQKGQGTNFFVIDGEKYDKVGLETPQHLVMWGYKELQVDKEYIRPQVSTQFEGFFLLGRPGSFISDVLSMASRLAVLLTATDKCSVDLRKNKQLQNIRKTDLEKASVRLEEMKPILLLNDRIKALQHKVYAAREGSNALNLKRDIFKQYQKLLPTVGLKLPVSTLIPEDLGAREAEIRKLLTQRDKLQNLPQISESKVKFDSAIQHADEWRIKLNDIRNAATAYNLSKDQYRKRLGAFDSISTEVEELEAKLSMLRSELKVCPLCDQPMSEAHAHV